MGQSFFSAPRPGIGGSSVTVTNFPSPELVNINQATPGTTNGVQLKAGSAIAGVVGIDQTTPGTTNAVQVTNLPSTPVSASNPLPVELYGPSSSPVTDDTWSGALASILSAVRAQSAGSVANRVVEAISAGSETDTLSRPTGCSNFVSGVVFNPTTSECTFTIGNSGGTTATVQANSTYPFDCNVSKLVLHATAANQQINGWVYDPTVT